MSRAAMIEARAAEWLVRRDRADWSPADDDALDRWLNEDVGHKAAFWRLEAGWAAADRLASTRVPFTQSGRMRTLRPRAWAIAAAVVLMCALSVTLWLVMREPGMTRVAAATPIGGRQDLALTDGSRVTLNTRTAIRANIGGGRREVWIDRGEAYFEIAHDVRHPFVVHAGDRKVTVLGTKFSVRRDGPKLTVAVTEGRVRVQDAVARSDRAVIITPGDMAIARGPSILLTDRSQQRVENELSWRRGVLTFDRTTLREAADEFNRYNTQPIRIDDPAVGQIRIGGAFDARHPDAFIRLLRDAFGLRAVEERGGVTIKS